MKHAHMTIGAAPEICWGMVDDDLLLFDPIDRRLHVLNNTAAMVWALTDDSIQVRQIVQRLSAEFRMVPQQIEDDIDSVVDNLLATGLCINSDRPPAPRLHPPEVPRLQSAPARPGPFTVGPFHALGATLLIAVPDPLLSAEISRVLAPLAEAGVDVGAGRGVLAYQIQGTDKGFDLSVNGRTLARHMSRAVCLRTLLSDCNASPLDFVDDALVLHASGARIDGQLFVFPGVSNAGKSTLVAQLVQRGHGYLTDEAVAVHVDTLQAEHYHKAICVDPGAHSLFPELEPERNETSDDTWDIDPRLFGPGILTGGGDISALVFPIFRPNTEASLRPIDPIETMHRLLRNSFDFSLLGQAGFAALIRIANLIPAWEFGHGGDGHLDILESVAGGPALLSLD